MNELFAISNPSALLYCKRADVGLSSSVIRDRSAWLSQMVVDNVWPFFRLLLMQLLLKMKRPVGAIRDCDEALKLNSDYGRAYRIRGTAHRYLGNWEDAHNDIETGQRVSR